MSINKRVLVLANYPIKEPIHGGQKRVAAIVEEYKKTFAAVKFVAIFVREHYPIHSPSDIYLTGEWAERVRHDHLTSDIMVGRAMTESPQLKRKIVDLLKSFRPDIIEVEQIFPFIGLKPILRELGIKPKIVCSSQNAETPMRADIMKISGVNEAAIGPKVSIIHETEAYLARHADLVTVVSSDDDAYYKQLGAKRCILAPNGISRPVVTQKAANYWQNFFARRGVRRIILFVASSHIPNIEGVRKVIGMRLGYLPPDTRLVLAGKVGDYIHDHFDNTNILDTTFWQRTIRTGVLNEDLLSGLLHIAEVILLPIVDGGGSNLKTAEAILSGKKVVATNFAFRGYDAYRELPNLWIKDEPANFHHAIVEALNAPLVARSEDEQKLAEGVEWKHTLASMVKEVGQL